MNITISRMNSRRSFTTRFQGKPFRIEWSRAARRALENVGGPLLVEMELSFGCLICKRVRFFERDSDKCFEQVAADVSLAFRPVITRSCDIDEYSRPVVEGLDTRSKSDYVPKWLSIHHRDGVWEGTFGY